MSKIYTSISIVSLAIVTLLTYIFIDEQAKYHIKHHIKRSITSISLNQSTDRMLPTIDNNRLLESAQKILNDIKSNQFNAYSCVEYLSSLEKQLDKLNVIEMNYEQLIKDAQKIIDTSWSIRTTLHSKLEKMPKECAEQMINNFRQFRFVEEYLGEISLKIPNMYPENLDFLKAPTPIMERFPDYDFKLAPKYLKYLKGVEFQTGDILLTRGPTFRSSMVARIGERLSQFSHLAFVYKDEETKKVYTYEAYIGEGGTDIYDIDFALRNDNSLMLWIRPKNAEYGKQAGEFIKNFKKDYEKQNMTKIPYDFALDFKDRSKLSCAELVQLAYDGGTKGELLIPQYINKVRDIPNFLQESNLPSGEIFEPGDMEIDSRFEIVGEFADLRITRDNRHKDVIHSELFRWMKDYDYKFIPNMESKIAKNIFPAARPHERSLWPLTRGLIKMAKGIDIPNFQKDIPGTILSLEAYTNSIGAVLLQEIRTRDEAFIKEHGVPMTYLELYQTINDFRESDFELYQQEQEKEKHKNISKGDKTLIIGTSKLHQLIHP